MLEAGDILKEMVFVDMDKKTVFKGSDSQGRNL